MTARTRFTALDGLCFAVGALIVAAGVAIVFLGPPGDLPIHYGPDGTADDWAGREAVGAVIAGLGVLLLLICGGMGLAAARTEDPARRRGLRANQLTALAAVSGVVLFGAGASLSQAQTLSGAVPMAGTSVILLAVGAFIGRAAPNPFVGVRTPWTYKSRLAWDRSNRLAGRLLCLIGLAGLAAAAFAPQPAGVIALVTAALVAGAGSVFESWRVWRADPDRQPF